MWPEKIMIIGNECVPFFQILHPLVKPFFYKMFSKMLLSLISITPVVFEYICWDIGGISCDP